MTDSQIEMNVEMVKRGISGRDFTSRTALNGNNKLNSIFLNALLQNQSYAGRYGIS